MNEEWKSMFGSQEPPSAQTTTVTPRLWAPCRVGRSHGLSSRPWGGGGVQAPHSVPIKFCGSYGVAVTANMRTSSMWLWVGPCPIRSHRRGGVFSCSQL